MLLRAVDGIIIYLLPFNTDLSTILPTLNYYYDGLCPLYDRPSTPTTMDYALSTIDPQRLATLKLRVKTELRYSTFDGVTTYLGCPLSTRTSLR